MKKMGGWIGKWFRSLGWGFEKRYREALIRQHQWLTLIGISTTRRINSPRLKEVYVSLRLAKGSSDLSARFSWNKAFDPENKYLVILGQPGAGKSTLMDYLVLVFSGHVPHILPGQLGKPLPLFLRLRDLVDAHGSRTLREALFAPEIVGNERRPAGFFERKLRGGSCIVLLDGLDEVLDHRQHEQIVQEIRQVVNDYPDNYFVVTCRVAGWHNQLPNFRVHEVQSFDDDDIREFIGAWYREVLRTERLSELETDERGAGEVDLEKKAFEDASVQAGALWSALRKNEELLRIARTPLILSLITLVYYIDQEQLPRGRTRLYKRCLDILLDEWDWKEKKLDIPNRPSLNDKLFIMKAVAYHFLVSGVVQLDRETLHELLEPLLQNLSVSASPSEIIEHIWKRSGILQEQALDRFGFAHRALLDYLAASVVVEQNNESMLLEHVDEEAWREVILIAIGLLKPARRAQSLIKALYENPDDDDRLVLAGWSLAEDVQVGKDIRGEVIQRITSRLEVTDSSTDFLRLTDAFMAAESTAAVAWIRSVLSGRDVHQQRRLLDMMPQFGEKGRVFTPVLLDIIEKAKENDLRVGAAHALSFLVPDPDGRCWTVLRGARNTDDDSLRRAANWAWCMLGKAEDLGVIKIPAGESVIGEDKERHTLFLPDYFISRYPVTGLEFRTFTENTGYKPGNAASLKCPDDHPVKYVSWNDAVAYAEAGGFVLPSEAEWEKAARGTDGRTYPWGNEWDITRANSSEYWSDRRGRVFLWRRRYGKTTPLGQFSPEGDSPYGCVDMVGNVWEWTRSLYRSYPYEPEDGREDEKAPGARVLRGGSFGNDLRSCRCAARIGRGPGRPRRQRGFSCCCAPLTDDR